MQVKDMDFIIGYAEKVHVFLDRCSLDDDTLEYDGLYGRLPKSFRVAEITALYPTSENKIGIRCKEMNKPNDLLFSLG